MFPDHFLPNCFRFLVLCTVYSGYITLTPERREECDMREECVIRDECDMREECVVRRVCHKRWVWHERWVWHRDECDCETVTRSCTSIYYSLSKHWSMSRTSSVNSLSFYFSEPSITRRLDIISSGCSGNVDTHKSPQFWPQFSTSLSTDRQHLSYDVCLEVRGEIIRTVLCCIVYWSCAQS